MASHRWTNRNGRRGVHSGERQRKTVTEGKAKVLYSKNRDREKRHRRAGRGKEPTTVSKGPSMVMGNSRETESQRQQEKLRKI